MKTKTVCIMLILSMFLWNNRAIAASQESATISGYPVVGSVTISLSDATAQTIIVGGNYAGTAQVSAQYYCVIDNVVTLVDSATKSYTGAAYVSLEKPAGARSYKIEATHKATIGAQRWQASTSAYK